MQSGSWGPASESLPISDSFLLPSLYSTNIYAPHATPQELISLFCSHPLSICLSLSLTPFLPLSSFPSFYLDLSLPLPVPSRSPGLFELHWPASPDTDDGTQRTAPTITDTSPNKSLCSQVHFLPITNNHIMNMILDFNLYL